MDTGPRAPASLLIVTPDDVFGRTLETLLAPAGYQITRVYRVDEVIQRARREAPDIVVLHADLLRTDTAATCARLRELPELGHRTPMVVCSSHPLTPVERRDALRAGAWHLFEAPFHLDDILPRLEVFIQAKREAETFREAALRDPDTGLYTPQGMQHRAVDLASRAARAREPLACVVLAPAAATVARQALLEAVARALRDLGRRSDAIGSLGDDLFAVVAPATPVSGAARMAERLANGVDIVVRPDLRAGFDVAPMVDQPSTVAPRLIDHARRAASEATTEAADGWLREYRGT
jgi:PleD family two-component response regulator